VSQATPGCEKSTRFSQASQAQRIGVRRIRRLVGKPLALFAFKCETWPYEHRDSTMTSFLQADFEVAIWQLHPVRRNPAGNCSLDFQRFFESFPGQYGCAVLKRSAGTG
jgi:hypothetical protein